jgi:hypothetical protein
MNDEPDMVDFLAFWLLTLCLVGFVASWVLL